VTHRWESAILLAKSSGLFAEERPSVFEWLKWKIACPLLEDGKCIAYDRRPAACRAHLAVGLPQKCEDDREHQLFAGSAKQSFGMSSAIISHHFGLGQPLVMDNLLALLSLDLIGERMETVSALEVKVDP
jgi:hypothetical protein